MTKAAFPKRAFRASVRKRSRHWWKWSPFLLRNEPFRRCWMDGRPLSGHRLPSHSNLSHGYFECPYSWNHLWQPQSLKFSSIYLYDVTVIYMHGMLIQKPSTDGWSIETQSLTSIPLTIWLVRRSTELPFGESPQNWSTISIRRQLPEASMT